MAYGFPSIWVAKYSSLLDWKAVANPAIPVQDIISDIDHKHVPGRGPQSIRAYCSCCDAVTDMHFDWNYGWFESGKIAVGWSEAYWCQVCSMNNRMRAVWSFVKGLNLPPESDVYLPEAVTIFFPRWPTYYRAQGSEYISWNAAPGSYHYVEGHGPIRHEDLRNLSFKDKSFDLIVSQEVFEHVPNYEKSFAECARILRPGGRLVFTVPFLAQLDTTIIRAKMNEDGTVEHYLPPEYHGNPMTGEGSLTFQYFGWDMLDHLREAGFSQANAHQFWGPWEGHAGWPIFVFEAIK